MSDKSLIQVQGAKQTVFGTAVTPMTVKFMEITDITTTPVMDVERLVDMRGSLAPDYIAVLKKQGVTGNIKGNATYEDICYWIEALAGVATPAGTGPYVRTGVGPLTTVVATPRLFTFTVGENVDGPYEIDGVVGVKLTLDVKNADKLTFQLDFIGLKVPGAGTLAALSDRTVTPIMASDMTLAVDAWAGTIGSTTYPASVYSANLVLDAKRDVRYYLGNVAPGRYREPMRWDVQFKGNFEFIKASPYTSAFLDSIIALTPGSVFNRQVRLKAINGTNILQLDMAGVNEKAPPFWNYNQEVQVIDLDLMGQYNPTLGNYFAYSSTNGVSALP